MKPRLPSTPTPPHIGHTPQNFKTKNTTCQPHADRLNVRSEGHNSPTSTSRVCMCGLETKKRKFCSQRGSVVEARALLSWVVWPTVNSAIGDGSCSVFLLRCTTHTTLHSPTLSTVQSALWELCKPNMAKDIRSSFDDNRPTVRTFQSPTTAQLHTAITITDIRPTLYSHFNHKQQANFLQLSQSPAIEQVCTAISITDKRPVMTFNKQYINIM